MKIGNWFLRKIGVYQHLKTGNIYLKLVTTKIKLDEIWQPCVIYTPFPKFNRFWVRRVENFEQSFKKF